ncbi:MAG: hypothetical protein WCX73_00695 [Candidatus Pacearchaeota archaeon]|jgi:hypothetical protein
MEHIHEYRGFLDKETKQIFVNSFKKAISKIDKNKFGLICIVGSINNEKSHDIDILIFPNKGIKIGEAIIELVKLYDSTEKFIKKHHERYYIVPCPKFAMQEMVYYLAASQEGAAGMIPLHSMFFTNYRDLVKFSPRKFMNRVKTEMVVLHGSLKQIKDIPALPQKKLEPYFFVLDFEMASRIRNFPKHLIRTSSEALFDYLKKKYKIPIKDKVPHNIGQIEKEFIKIMRELDKKTYS